MYEKTVNKESIQIVYIYEEVLYNDLYININTQASIISYIVTIKAA